MTAERNAQGVGVLAAWDELVSAAGEIDNGAEHHDDSSGQALVLLCDLERLIAALVRADEARADAGACEVTTRTRDTATFTACVIGLALICTVPLIASIFGG